MLNDYDQMQGSTFRPNSSLKVSLLSLSLRTLSFYQPSTAMIHETSGFHTERSASVYDVLKVRKEKLKNLYFYFPVIRAVKGEEWVSGVHQKRKTFWTRTLLCLTQFRDRLYHLYQVLVPCVGQIQARPSLHHPGSGQYGEKPRSSPLLSLRVFPGRYLTRTPGLGRCSKAAPRKARLRWGSWAAGWVYQALRMNLATEYASPSSSERRPASSLRTSKGDRVLGLSSGL